MLSVQQAELLILEQKKDFGTQKISLSLSAGRILAEPIFADRDIPPFNRATMDGIAIKFSDFEKGQRTFFIKTIQAAGQEPKGIPSQECIEIMTGASLSTSVDTVIRYEDLILKDDFASVLFDGIKLGQNIQHRANEKSKGDLLIAVNTKIGAAEIATLASVGKTEVLVKTLPSAVILSTGDEVVPATAEPLPYQVRASNSIAIKTLLAQQGLEPQMLHVPDDLETIKNILSNCLEQYDVILLTGGVSAGKFDLLPQAFKELEIQEIFYKIAQRPGKPLWFGKSKNDKSVFGFPGNPVSCFLCTLRYFIPWLQQSLGIEKENAYAILSEDVSFAPSLHYFLPVYCSVNKKGEWIAKPVKGSGSGDYLQLLEATAFMELPPDEAFFKKGTCYPIWPYRSLL